jgi:hypothetical protein
VLLDAATPELSSILRSRDAARIEQEVYRDDASVMLRFGIQGVGMGMRGL